MGKSMKAIVNGEPVPADAEPEEGDEAPAQ